MNLFKRRAFFLDYVRKLEAKEPIWLPYLESTGTQYINLKDFDIYEYLSKSKGKFSVVVNVKWNDITPRQAMGSNSTGYFDINSQLYGLGGGNRSTITPSTTKYDSIKLEWEYKSVSTSGINTSNILYIDGILGTSRSCVLSRTTSELANLYLFALNYSTKFPCNCKVSSTQIYDGNKLIANLRPCLNPTTLRPALYDTISKKYYYNSGSGEFGYDLQFVKLDYIESDGNQYIDTGITGTSDNIELSVEMQLNENQVFGFPLLFGSHSRTGGSNRFYIAVRNDLTGIFLGAGNNELSKYSIKDLTQKNTFYYKDKTYYQNEMELGSVAESYDIFSIYLLTGNFDGDIGTTRARCIVGKLYNSQIGIDNTLVRDYIPCRMNDGQIGLWDFISGSFFGNSGTGKFKTSDNNLFTLAQGIGNYENAPDVSYKMLGNKFEIKGACPSNINWAICKLTNNNYIVPSLSLATSESNGQVFLNANTPYKITTDIVSIKEVNFVVVYADKSRQVFSKLDGTMKFTKDVIDIWIRNNLSTDKNVDIVGSITITE